MSLSYPTLTEIGTTRDFIESFGGYNHNLRIGENEFYDMKNLTSTYYPVLSSRSKRGTYPLRIKHKDTDENGNVVETEVDAIDEYGEPVDLNNFIFVGCFSFEGKIGRVFYLEEELKSTLYVVYKKKLIPLGETIPDESNRTVVNFGSYIVIFPDKKYINLVDTSFISSGDVEFHFCNKDGEAFIPHYVSDTAPADVGDGDLWLDTSVEPAQLKEYSGYDWVSVPITYLKIEYDGIDKKLGNASQVIISGDTPSALDSIKDSLLTIKTKGKNYIVVEGVMSVDHALISTTLTFLGKEKGDLGKTYMCDCSENSVTFSLCKMDGTKLTPNSVGTAVPTDATNGYLWLDTSVSPASLKQYSGANDMWSSVMTTYIRIDSTGIDKDFNEYDGVAVSGITVPALTDLNASLVIHSKGDDYIVVVGVPTTTTDENGESVAVTTTSFTQEAGTITIERKVPEMDFVIESNNRLWGCRHGFNYKGEMVNEIYASKLGDFKNWEYFGGTSQDSYMVSLGSEGAFTGAISYNGKPHFFKQNILHIIYGSYPATYQLQNIECKGVQEGCSNSLVIVDNILYYKTTGSVCAYSGSFPTDIGYQLHENDWRYTDAFGGCFRHKYYLLLNDVKSGECPLFVYDTEKGVWHKEGVKGFDHHVYHGFINFSVNNVDALGYFNESYTECIKMVECIGDYVENETINWFAETGIMGCSSPDKKYISRIHLRLSLDVGTRVFVSFEYDSSGVWEQVATITGTNLHTFTLPIKARRCDHLRMKIEGNGAARIYSISKTIEQGSDV